MNYYSFIIKKINQILSISILLLIVLNIPFIGATFTSSSFVSNNTFKAGDWVSPTSTLSVVNECQLTNTWNISYTASDSPAGVVSVALYYRYGGVGAFSLSGTNAYVPTSSVSDTFTFTAADGYGLYEFYTIATDNAGNVETKLIADDSTTYILPIVINEIYYDVDAGYGVEGTNEWVELYNPNTFSVDMSGWSITDNMSNDVLSGSIPAGGFFLITNNASTWTYWSIGSTTTFNIGSDIGNGLGNNGDRLSLEDDSPIPVVMDLVSYGTDTTYLNPAIPDVIEGHSVERNPDGLDTNTFSDFMDRLIPTPGN